MMALAWLFVKANWKPIAAVLAVLLVIGWHKKQVNDAWHEGRDALKVEQRKEAEKRDADAKAADDGVRDCARDSSCLLRDDEHRRD